MSGVNQFESNIEKYDLRIDYTRFFYATKLVNNTQ